MHRRKDPGTAIRLASRGAIRRVHIITTVAVLELRLLPAAQAKVRFR